MTTDDFADYVKRNYRSTSSFLSGAMIMLTDAIIIMLCIGTSFFIINFINHSWINFRSFVTYSVYLPVILIVFYAANLYPGIMLSPTQEVKNLCICTLFSFVGIALSISVETDDRWPISVALIMVVPIAGVCLPIGRSIARTLFSKYDWWGVPVVIYCKDDSANVIIHRLLSRPDLGYKPCCIINSGSFHGERFEGVPVFTNTSGIEEIIHALNIKVAILCDFTQDISSVMTRYRYTIKIPRKQAAQTVFSEPRDFGGILGFSSTYNLSKTSNIVLKRTFDIALILVTLPLTVPVCLFVALLIKLFSRGPIFYGHKRIGKDGKEFKCWKFRSMVVDADKILDSLLKNNPKMKMEWEKDCKLENDPRVTKIGHILRKTSLDELPQLWNIFIGQMSFVGPRPVTAPELKKYGDKATQFLLKVTPGLSGMWQVSGRSETEYEERVGLDIYYIQNWSIWLDMWIMLKTFWIVINRRGAY